MEKVIKEQAPRSSLLSDEQRSMITEKHDELVGEGRLPTRTQLEKQYQAFRDRFGPLVLADIDGEPLLNLMHDHSNHDSLVFWLEWKNDDDFETKQFGSIVGGSALKFRIFRRKETRNWQAADERNKPADISLEEAIGYARTHRDQLLKGVELLERLPQNASDEEYADLQHQMDAIAPDVSKFAWGHKYFSLLFPDRLDDYHRSEWQHFHLLKLLQLPPEGDGRYRCAGRFVQAASEVDLLPTQFTATLNALHGGPHRYWRIGTKSGKDGTSYWPMMRERNCIAIGWHEVEDLSWLEAKKRTRDELKEILEKTYPGRAATAIGNDCSQMINFVAKLSEGDIVIAADGSTNLGICRVVGEYRYEPKFDFPHQRPVEWLSEEEWEMPEREALRSTFRELNKYEENLLEAEKRIQHAPSPGPISRGITRARRPVRLIGISGRIQSVLERKSQVILYGPPGTGKTYWAEKAATELASLSAFGAGFDDLDEAQRAAVVGDRRSAGLVRICCFHPAYGYEDFLEGYRPSAVNGQMVFELRDGIFKRLCHDAQAAPERSFYLIVDEINRGDIPRIFGELLTTLEKDKRGKQILLPVSQAAFTVPRNVFFIGTMNTADRSISLLDAALRRRFGFIEMMPDGTVLRDSIVSGVPLRAWFDALNERIRQHVGRDARNLQVGHSYLMQSGSPVKEMAVLKRAIRDDVIPLLEEYCYEDFQTLATILGDELVDVASQRIRHELFEEGQEDALVSALLAPFPEISVSGEALSSDASSDEEASATEESDEAEGADVE